MTAYEVDGSIEKKIIKKFNNIPLGSVPIMLHSNSCVLSNMTSNTLFSMGECPYDEGGYFILKKKKLLLLRKGKLRINYILEKIKV